MENRKVQCFIWGIFIIFGMIFIIIGISTLIKTLDNNNMYIQSTADIVEITNDNNVYVSYEINGNKYDYIHYGIYDSSYKLGDEVTIYYNKEDPSEIITGLEPLTNIAFIVFGVIFGGIGIIAIIIIINKENKEKKLKKIGKLINANYIKTKINNFYSVNGKNPYIIICEWTDSQSNKTYKFESENLWEDPEFIIEENNIQTFPVYVDPNNIEKYYVDTQILEEKKVIIDI